jgi:hypothetical protein
MQCYSRGKDAPGITIYRGENEKTIVKLIFCLIDKRVLKKGIWQQSHVLVCDCQILWLCWFQFLK